MNIYPILSVARLYRQMTMYIHDTPHQVSPSELHDVFVMSGKFGQDTYVWAMRKIMEDRETYKLIVWDVEPEELS